MPSMLHPITSCAARPLSVRPEAVGCISCIAYRKPVLSLSKSVSGVLPATPNPHQSNSSAGRSRPDLVVTQASSDSSVTHNSQPSSGAGLPWGWIAVAALVTGGLAMASTSSQGHMIQEYLVNGPLGKSGFLAAFSLIFLSEIGDKTFFIAALLAAKIGKWMSFLGSVSSLGVMTIISVAIGAFFSKVPDALKSSIPVGELAGIALLVFFGVKALREGLKPQAVEAADDELDEAENAVKQAESSGRVKKNSPIKTFFEVASLIFIAEWGDRSMLATIALGAAQNPVGVAVGAIVGHCIATGIAVIGGAVASKYVSEKTINLVSGALFLLFAAMTAYSMVF